MNCFLIGSTGFVGSQIKSSLEDDGLEVFCLRRASAGEDFGPTAFSASENGDFSMELLSEFMRSHRISIVLHCGNVWDPSPSPPVAESMLYANILVPAKVYRAAVEARATTFVNLASAWQLDPEKTLKASDYVSTKQAFRTFLSLQSERLQCTSVFVNEVFGVGDPRRKLINRAIDCALHNIPMTVESADNVLGFTNVKWLGDEIVNLVRNRVPRPREYLFQNYSNITLREVLETVGTVTGGLSWFEESKEELRVSDISIEHFGERDRENFSSEIREVAEKRKSQSI